MTRLLPAPVTAAATVAALALCACEPEISIEHFRVAIAMVEHCTAHTASDETCADPEATVAIVPAVVESIAGGAVTLYATDPADGMDRAYCGDRDGDALELERSSRHEGSAGCVYTIDDQLHLAIDGDRISGSERRVSDEAGACNALGLRTVERIDWSWSGERVPLE
ncbi:MAG: hypothetical protein JXR83_18650 [Deltaproteobacteria bacterium]|nr:hypothetical protein [Deltaproteobacteria bacterium]